MDDRIAAQERAIEAARHLFETTGNPMFAWDAYARSRAEGLPIPDFVLKYLDTSARHLGALVDRARSGAKIKPATEIATAFGMSGAKGEQTVFSRFADDWLDTWLDDWRDIGERISAYLKEGDKEEIAIENVTRDLALDRDAVLEMAPHMDQPSSPSKSTVRRAWKKYQQACPSGQQFHKMLD